MNSQVAQNRPNPILEGVIWQQILLFFFPLLLGTFFQQLYNTTDTLIVGRYLGKIALSAVGGSTSKLTQLVIGFFMGISSGSTVVIAQFYGAGDRKRCSGAVHTAMTLALTGGGTLSLIGWWIAPWALEAMKTPPEVMAASVDYVRIYFAGLIFTMIYNMGAGILRAKGDSKRPFYLLVLCTLMNVVLDLLFVVRFGWGIQGVAWATVLAQFICASSLWFILAHEEEGFRIRVRDLGFDTILLQNIVRVGLPAGLQSSMYIISNTVIQSTINTFGIDAIAAWTIFGKVDAMYWMIMNAFGMSIVTFSGQNFGAHRYDRIKKSVGECTIMTVLVSLLAGAMMCCWEREAFALFTDDMHVTEIGIVMIRAMAPWYFTYAFIEVASGTVRGTGNSLTPMLLISVGICVFRLFWIWCVLPFAWSMDVLVYGYPASWALTSLIFLVYYFRGHWLEHSIARAGARLKII